METNCVILVGIDWASNSLMPLLYGVICMFVILGLMCSAFVWGAVRRKFMLLPFLFIVCLPIRLNATAATDETLVLIYERLYNLFVQQVTYEDNADMTLKIMNNTALMTNLLQQIISQQGGTSTWSRLDSLIAQQGGTSTWSRLDLIKSAITGMSYTVSLTNINVITNVINSTNFFYIDMTNSGIFSDIRDLMVDNFDVLCNSYLDLMLVSLGDSEAHLSSIDGILKYELPVQLTDIGGQAHADADAIISALSSIQSAVGSQYPGGVWSDNSPSIVGGISETLTNSLAEVVADLLDGMRSSSSSNWNFYLTDFRERISDEDGGIFVQLGSDQQSFLETHLRATTNLLGLLVGTNYYGTLTNVDTESFSGFDYDGPETNEFLDLMEANNNNLADLGSMTNVVGDDHFFPEVAWSLSLDKDYDWTWNIGNFDIGAAHFTNVVLGVDFTGSEWEVFRNFIDGFRTLLGFIVVFSTGVGIIKIVSGGV